MDKDEEISETEEKDKRSWKSKLFATTKFGIPLISLLLIGSLVVGTSVASGYIMLKVHSGDEVNIFGYVLEPKENNNITLNTFAVDKHGNKLDMDGNAQIYYDDGNTEEVLDNGDSLVKTISIENGNATTEVSKEGTYFVKYTNFGNYNINYTATYNTNREAPSLERELNVSVNSKDAVCSPGPGIAPTETCNGGIINGTVRNWRNRKIEGVSVNVRIQETGEILQSFTTEDGYYEVQPPISGCGCGETSTYHFDVFVSYGEFEKHINSTFHVSEDCSGLPPV